MENNNNTVQFITISAAAKLTGLSKYYIRERVKNGSIAYIQCGNRCLINVPRFLSQIDSESIADR